MQSVKTRGRGRNQETEKEDRCGEEEGSRDLPVLSSDDRMRLDRFRWERMLQSGGQGHDGEQPRGQRF